MRWPWVGIKPENTSKRLTAIDWPLCRVIESRLLYGSSLIIATNHRLCRVCNWQKWLPLGGIVTQVVRWCDETTATVMHGYRARAIFLGDKTDPRFEIEMYRKSNFTIRPKPNSGAVRPSLSRIFNDAQIDRFNSIRLSGLQPNVHEHNTIFAFLWVDNRPLPLHGQPSV